MSDDNMKAQKEKEAASWKTIFQLHAAILLIGFINISIAGIFFEHRVLLFFIPEVAIFILLLVKLYKQLKSEGAL